MYREVYTSERGGIISLKKYVTWFILVVAIGIVLAPFATQGYIYNSIVTHTDIVAHSNIINSFANGIFPSKDILYSAQVVFGGLLGIVGGFSGISAESLFLGFMALVLIGAGVSLYYVVSRIAGSRAGWLTVLIGILCTNSILILYRYGIVFSILEMYVILPFVILFAVKWLKTNKHKYLVAWLALLGVFSILHYVSLYVLPTLAMILAGLLVYKAMTHNPIKRYVSAVLLAGLLNAVILMGLFGAYCVLNKPIPAFPSFSLSYWHMQNVRDIINIIGLPTIIIASIVGLVVNLKRMVLDTSVKYYLFIICSLVVALVGGSLLLLFSSIDKVIADRVILDSSVIFAMIVAVMLNEVIRRGLVRIQVISYILIGVSSIYTLIVWVR